MPEAAVKYAFVMVNYPTEFPLECIRYLVDGVKNGDLFDDAKRSLTALHIWNGLGYVLSVTLGKPVIPIGSTPDTLAEVVGEIEKNLPLQSEGYAALNLQILVPLIAKLIEILLARLAK